MNFTVSGGGGNYKATYAYAEVTSPREMSVDLRIGSDDAIKVWLNGGAPVYERLAVRLAKFDENSVGVTLRRGTNRFLFKVLNKIGDFQLYARLCDASGQGLAELQYDPVPVNLPPTVDAWIETDSGNVEQITISSGQGVRLNGSVGDDGKPRGELTVTWSKQSGQGT